MRSTTIIAVQARGQVALAGDGQVTSGEHLIMKQGARKLRRLHQGRVLAGFAGAAADAVTLCDRFEGKLEEYRGNLLRAAVELAREWRLDRALRRLDAMMIVADSQQMLLISGTGDVIEPDAGALGIGSGGGYGLAAARVLLQHTQMSAAEIAREALLAAAALCPYTNEQITVEELP